MRQVLDLSTTPEDVIRAALFEAVLTGAETAAMRNDIKWLYSMMDKELLLEQMTKHGITELYAPKQPVITSQRELMRRETAAQKLKIIRTEHRVLKHLKPKVNWTDDETLVIDFMGLNCVSDAIVIAPDNIGVTCCGPCEGKCRKFLKSYKGEIYGLRIRTKNNSRTDSSASNKDQSLQQQ